MKSLCFFFFFAFLLSFSDARRFNVGGSGAWVPNPPVNYQSWAEESRFLVHDTLYFNYAKGADSVLEVNKADFEACNTKNPIKKMEDGETEVSLDRSGPFYFITGNEDNCKKGQKISVVVLSVKHAAAPGSSPGSMAPKSSSHVSPTTSPPGSMAPKSSSPVSPMTSPPAPVSPSSAPGSSPPGTMAPKSSSALSPSSAPGESPSSGSSSSPSSLSPSESPPAPSPTGSELGPSGNGPSAAGDMTTPAGAPDQKKSPANRMAVMSVTTVLLSLVLTIFVSA